MTNSEARMIGFAFDNLANKNFDPILVFKVMCRNLEFSEIGKVNEEIIYNPIFHEDLDSGMLPGDRGVVAQIGWICNLQPVLRAKIHKVIIDK